MKRSKTVIIENLKKIWEELNSVDDAGIPEEAKKLIKEFKQISLEIDKSMGEDDDSKRKELFEKMSTLRDRFGELRMPDNTLTPPTEDSSDTSATAKPGY